ncbi:MAG: AMP-binding protein [Rhodospirillales bacterium]|nr:AMP-binding protein [Rhodospirillales bacterium]
MAEKTAHVDTFAADNLPPRDQWPAFSFDRPEFQYPGRMNCATELLDDQVAAGFGGKAVFYTPRETWTYGELRERANRIARVLIEDFAIEPGNRVMIRAANNPMFVACWFAVAKAGGVVVAVMPLLRAGELATILEKAQIGLALCDARLAEDMEEARRRAPVCERICYFSGSGEAGAGAELEDRAGAKSADLENVDTASDDVVLIAFTSGTTGQPKGTTHFHRDIIAMCDAFPRSCLKDAPDDIFIGSPPIAFTFGLGGQVAFPMRVGASTVLLEAAPPEALLQGIEDFKATICFTAPTAYRAMCALLEGFDLSSLRKCVSAGETLPLPTFEAWRAATGHRIIDGLGSTEMLHIFIAVPEDKTLAGATGKPIPGYEARVVDDEMKTVAPGTVGRLAVRGPTGCRYLADARQREYVVDGWNLTGDAYKMDEDGYFWFQARIDDMIISSGHNISGPEVEAALLSHDAIAECAVVASPDDERGNIVKVYVVPRSGVSGSEQLTKELQDHVKATIAPYKYPRAIEFTDALPKTQTGKVQRFVLRQREQTRRGT